MGKKLILLLFIGIIPIWGICATSSSNIIFGKNNACYLVNDEIDLHGQVVQIPEGCVLRFKGKGSISNGVLVGRRTRIKANKTKKIFKDIEIRGEWNVHNIYDSWFVFGDGQDHTSQIRNIFCLCSKDVVNNVYFSDNTYWLQSYNEEEKTPDVILIPSNTHVHSQATFNVLPGSFIQSFLFYFYNVSNCSWDGGQIVGDLKTHYGDKGEQGFGIALRGAKNIIIKNVTCKECWGDGINLQYLGGGIHNENICIHNVVCDNNRRQGISIEDGIRVKITHSSFLNSGKYRGTAPGYGLDIEPCYNNAAIKDIVIDHCLFENNNGGGLCCSFLKETDDNIIISNCTDIDGGVRINNCPISLENKGISITNYQCPNGKLRFKRFVRNVNLKKCCFMSALNESRSSKMDTLINARFDNVIFKTKEQRTWNYYCLSLICALTDEIVFKSCLFEVLEGSNLSAIFAPTGDWSGVRIIGCEIVEHRNNTVFVPCDIINSVIKSRSHLSFSNQKKRTLLFRNNKVLLGGETIDNPFGFVEANNQYYKLLNNTIYYSKATSMNDLIMKHNINKEEPLVYLKGNTYRSIR